MLRTSDATDPRDKVCAGLGLTDECDLAIPDYGLDFDQVYTAVAQDHIEKHGNLYVLGHCYLPPDSPLDNSVPSWVPEWRIPNKVMPLCKSSRSVENVRVYGASGNTSLNFVVSEDFRSLSLPGVFVDSIAITRNGLKGYAADREIDSSYLGNNRLVEIMSVTCEWADMVELFYNDLCTEKEGLTSYSDPASEKG